MIAINDQSALSRIVDAIGNSSALIHQISQLRLASGNLRSLSNCVYLAVLELVQVVLSLLRSSVIGKACVSTG